MEERKIISREEARALGLKKFFTGKPCNKYGHVCERRTDNGSCVDCVSIITSERYYANQEVSKFKNHSKEVAKCRFCGNNFYPLRQYLNHPTRGKFCSLQCSGKGRQKRKVTMIDAICQNCLKPFSYAKGTLPLGKYCSQRCNSIGTGIRMRGENHPRWKGGHSTKRPPEVKRVGLARVKEVGHCERCGSTEYLHGHHKEYYADNLDKAANPDNIEVLCSVCHGIEHPEMKALLTMPRQLTGEYFPCANPLCNNTFYTTPGHPRKFCNQVCMGLYNRGRKKRCSVCGSDNHNKKFHSNESIKQKGLGA